MRRIGLDVLAEQDVAVTEAHREEQLGEEVGQGYSAAALVGSDVFGLVALRVIKLLRTAVNEDVVGGLLAVVDFRAGELEGGVFRFGWDVFEEQVGQTFALNVVDSGDDRAVAVGVYEVLVVPRARLVVQLAGVELARGEHHLSICVA